MLGHFGTIPRTSWGSRLSCSHLGGHPEALLETSWGRGAAVWPSHFRTARYGAIFGPSWRHLELLGQLWGLGAAGPAVHFHAVRLGDILGEPSWTHDHGTILGLGSWGHPGVILGPS